MTDFGLDENNRGEHTGYENLESKIWERAAEKVYKDAEKFNKIDTINLFSDVLKSTKTIEKFTKNHLNSHSTKKIEKVGEALSSLSETQWIYLYYTALEYSNIDRALTWKRLSKIQGYSASNYFRTIRKEAVGKDPDKPWLRGSPLFLDHCIKVTIWRGDSRKKKTKQVGYKAFCLKGFLESYANLIKMLVQLFEKVSLLLKICMRYLEVMYIDFGYWAASINDAKSGHRPIFPKITEEYKPFFENKIAFEDYYNSQKGRKSYEKIVDEFNDLSDVANIARALKKMGKQLARPYDEKNQKIYEDRLKFSRDSIIQTGFYLTEIGKTVSSLKEFRLEEVLELNKPTIPTSEIIKILKSRNTNATKFGKKITNVIKDFLKWISMFIWLYGLDQLRVLEEWSSDTPFGLLKTLRTLSAQTFKYNLITSEQFDQRINFLNKKSNK